jgi:hypothetical protein
LIIPGGHTVSVPLPSEGCDMLLGVVAMLEPLLPSIVPLDTPPSEAPVISGPREGVGPTDGPAPPIVDMPVLPDRVVPLPDRLPEVPLVPSNVPAPAAGPAPAAPPGPLPNVLPLGDDSSLPGVEAVLGVMPADGRLGREPAPVGAVCAIAAVQATSVARARTFFIGWLSMAKARPAPIRVAGRASGFTAYCCFLACPGGRQPLSFFASPGGQSLALLPMVLPDDEELDPVDEPLGVVAVLPLEVPLPPSTFTLVVLLLVALASEDEPLVLPEPELALGAVLVLPDALGLVLVLPDVAGAVLLVLPEVPGDVPVVPEVLGDVLVVPEVLPVLPSVVPGCRWRWSRGSCWSTAWCCSSRATWRSWTAWCRWPSRCCPWSTCCCRPSQASRSRRRWTAGRRWCRCRDRWSRWCRWTANRWRRTTSRPWCRGSCCCWRIARTRRRP